MSAEREYFPAKNEKNVMGRFEYFDQPAIKASIDADEPRTIRIIVCRSRAAGSSDDSVVPVRPFNQHALIARFPEAWADFNGEASEQPTGTPLAEIGIDESAALNMRLYAVTSVESLAAISDAACTNVGFGSRKWREKAQAFLKAKEDELLQAAKDMVTEKRKPGRPKKSDAAIQTAA